MLNVMENMSATIVDDFKLIELVRQNRHLYDKNHNEYRDILKKSITWKAIGVALGASGELCRKRFRCLRDRFNKERKVRKNEMLTDTSLPSVYKKMLFLWDHLTHRRAPVATRIPADDSKSAAVVREEIEKQIQMLKGGEESCEEENSSCELQNEIVLIFDETGKMPEANRSGEQQEGVVCRYVVPENTAGENSASEHPAQIIFVNKDTGNNSEENVASEQSDESDNKKGIVEESSEEPNETGRAYDKRKEISENHNTPNQRNEIVPTSNSTRSLVSSSAFEQPSKRMKTSGNTVQLTKKIDTPVPKVGPTPKPSCNEAFCAIVKHYLDKITSPERLSSARLQILTILHNELYSTYS